MSSKSGDQGQANHRTFTITKRDGQEIVIFRPIRGVNVSLDLPSTKGKRVFVGGDYNHLPDLREIKRHVDSLGYISIIPYDCGMPLEYVKDFIHSFDMFLLGECRYAIFEVTSAAGQLMELQRAIDNPECEVRVLYKTRDDQQLDIPEHVSSMITTSVRNLRGYSNFEDLPGIIKEFFPKGDILVSPTVKALSLARGARERPTEKAVPVLVRMLQRIEARERERQRMIRKLTKKGGKQ
ncbi:hypothetical protein ES703_03461 [subsurface metagenome]